MSKAEVTMPAPTFIKELIAGAREHAETMGWTDAQVVGMLIDALEATEVAWGDAEVVWEYGHDCDESREVHGDSGSPHNPWVAGDTCVNITAYCRAAAGPWVRVTA